MEKLLFRIIWAGFILLTLTIASGVIYSEELFGKAAKFNHKTVFGVLSWIIFAPCSPAGTSTAGAGASRCAGRSPAFSCSCSPISAASSCSK